MSNENCSEWIIIGTEWGEGFTSDEERHLDGAATEWCTENEGPSLAISFRRALPGEAAGTYRKERDGSLQIYGYTLPVPAEVEDLTSRAWVHALETMR